MTDVDSGEDVWAQLTRERADDLHLEAGQTVSLTARPDATTRVPAQAPATRRSAVLLIRNALAAPTPSSFRITGAEVSFGRSGERCVAFIPSNRTEHHGQHQSRREDLRSRTRTLGRPHQHGCVRSRRHRVPPFDRSRSRWSSPSPRPSSVSRSHCPLTTVCPPPSSAWSRRCSRSDSATDCKLDADKQAFLLSAAATLSAMFVRTQATARVPATVPDQPQVPAHSHGAHTVARRRPPTSRRLSRRSSRRSQTSRRPRSSRKPRTSRVTSRSCGAVAVIATTAPHDR